jgi:hypothetical protein
MYNNLRYFVLTVAAYEGTMPSPLKDNYPLYDLDEDENIQYNLDEDGNPILNSPILKTSYTFQEVNEHNGAWMWCFPKTMDYGDGEVTVWVGKENKEALWDEADIAALEALEGASVFDHEGILTELKNYQVMP